MRKYFLLLTLLSLPLTGLWAQCTNVYSSATYALAHTKRALKADNFDHQMLYSERALEALEKTRKQMESCDCKDAMPEIDRGIDMLAKAVEPDNWEEGRYYTKQAYEHAGNLMGRLDLCTTNSGAGEPVVEQAPEQAPATPAANSNEKKLLLAKQDLEAKKQELLRQQQLLEAEIEAQQAREATERLERAEELEKQKILRAKAEEQLTALSGYLRQLAESLGCTRALSVLDTNFSRSEQALKNESLEQTRQFYLDRTITLQNEVTKALRTCRESR